MRGAGTRSLLLFVSAGPAVTVASACSSGSGSGSTTNHGDLKLSTVNLYTLGSPDTAPVWLAQQEGYFKDESLNVKSATRLQRVVDLMQPFGDLPANFNLDSMLVPLPSGS
jgi:ABC-type nitrate/sulfonate/bicarbonate transport system substrate-binding protein